MCIYHIHDLHVGKLLLLDLVDGGGAGLHIVPPVGHQRGAQGAEQRLKVCLVSGAGRGAYLVISLGQLRDGGEGGGHPDYREERGVGGREHVEQDHAGEAHQEEDQPSGDACRLILSILDDRKIRSLIDQHTLSCLPNSGTFCAKALRYVNTVQG